MFAYVGFFLYLCAVNAAAAKWWPLNALPKLAFDHDKILRDAKRVMNIKVKD
jgi:hypothetical protein